MNIYKFKTTMSCSGCVSKVEKFLNEEKDILKWEVDLNSPDKILTIETEKPGIKLCFAKLFNAIVKLSV